METSREPKKLDSLASAHPGANEKGGRAGRPLRDRLPLYFDFGLVVLGFP